jgi:hypothetical protein
MQHAIYAVVDLFTKEHTTFTKADEPQGQCGDVDKRLVELQCGEVNEKLDEPQSQCREVDELHVWGQANVQPTLTFTYTSRVKSGEVLSPGNVGLCNGDTQLQCYLPSGTTNQSPVSVQGSLATAHLRDHTSGGQAKFKPLPTLWDHVSTGKHAGTKDSLARPPLTFVNATGLKGGMTHMSGGKHAGAKDCSAIPPLTFVDVTGLKGCMTHIVDVTGLKGGTTHMSGGKHAGLLGVNNLARPSLTLVDVTGLKGGATHMSAGKHAGLLGADY